MVPENNGGKYCYNIIQGSHGIGSLEHGPEIDPHLHNYTQSEEISAFDNSEYNKWHLKKGSKTTPFF